LVSQLPEDTIRSKANKFHENILSILNIISRQRYFFDKHCDRNTPPPPPPPPPDLAISNNFQMLLARQKDTLYSFGNNNNNYTIRIGGYFVQETDGSIGK